MYSLNELLRVGNTAALLKKEKKKKRSDRVINMSSIFPFEMMVDKLIWRVKELNYYPLSIYIHIYTVYGRTFWYNIHHNTVFLGIVVFYQHFWCSLSISPPNKVV